MNELQFDVKLEAGSIKMDSEKLEKQLSETMAEYKAKEFTEDTKKEAKADLAYLRDIKKQVNARDGEIKKRVMEPYTTFHEGVKRLIVLIDEPINLIDGQVKNFEEKRVAAKKKDIKEAYAEIVDESLSDYIPLECIYGDKWNNAGTTMKSIRKELQEITTKTRNDIDVIAAINSDAVEKALHFYMGNRDITKAIKYINDYEAQKAAILRAQEEKKKQEYERDRQAEAERIRREERQRIREEERIKEEAKKEAVTEIKKVNEQEAAPLTSKESIKVIYTVVATQDEISEIEMALTSLGVYFERKDV